MGFDTKYRPDRFSDVVGQDISVAILSGFVTSGKGFSQSYVFAGTHGIGKTTLARIFAKALLCESPLKSGESCNKCKSCTSLDSKKDNSIVEVDAAGNSGKEEIRKLIEEAQFASYGGRQKIFIIDEAHQLSKAAEDSLLKPLEEDIQGTDRKRLICIFCTTERYKIRSTITSRCAPILVLNPVPTFNIVERLIYACDMENLRFELDALEFIANKASNHVREALKMLEAVSTSGDCTLDNVRSYFGADHLDSIVSLLTNLRDFSDIESVRNILVHFSPDDINSTIYSILNSSFVYKNIGISPSGIWDSTVCSRISDAYSDSEFKMLISFFSTRSKVLDEAVLLCNLLLIKSMLSAVGLSNFDHETSDISRPSNNLLPSVNPPRMKLTSIPRTVGPVKDVLNHQSEDKGSFTKSGIYIIPSAVRGQKPEVTINKNESPSESFASERVISADQKSDPKDVAKSIIDRFTTLCQKK